MKDRNGALDHEILMLLWRWKVLSSMNISLHLRRGPRAESTYRKLLRMQSNNLITKIIGSDGKRTMWSLSRNGYRTIKPRLPPLKQDGYKSEYPLHDFICSAIHSATHVALPEDNIETFSEQELRRISLTGYPLWVPTDEEHRSDGYWCIPKNGKIKLVSLEVELNHQAHEKYRKIGNYYHRNEQIEEVLWIFRTLPDAVGCLTVINRLLAMDAKYHRFTTLKEMTERGWDAQTHVMHQGQVKAHQKLVRSLSVNDPKSDLRHFLNMQNCHYNSDSYTFPK